MTGAGVALPTLDWAASPPISSSTRRFPSGPRWWRRRIPAIIPGEPRRHVVADRLVHSPSGGSAVHGRRGSFMSHGFASRRRQTDLLPGDQPAHSDRTVLVAGSRHRTGLGCAAGRSIARASFGASRTRYIAR